MGFGVGVTFQLFNVLSSGSTAETGLRLFVEIAAVGTGLSLVCALIGPKRAARLIEWLGGVQ